ncbi:MAG TPA: GntR family transcriptional regulator [Propylenella sp.]
MLDKVRPPARRRRTEKATASTLVYGKLRQDILKGAFKPGQKLLIELIAARYEVGINPVREALNRLSAEALVDRHDQRGFFVAPISIERWRELVKTRCWLETKALEESIANRNPVWEERIVLAFHHFSRTPFDPSPGGLAGAAEWELRHRAFHMALIAACGSSWLLDFCEDMMDQAQRYRFISFSAAHTFRDSVAEHRMIMDATLDANAPLAVERLTDHYRLTLKVIEDQILR